MIKLSNTAALQAAIDSVRGRADAHTLTTAREMMGVAEAAEARLAGLGVPKGERAGALYHYRSGGAVPGAYKYARLVSSLVLCRRAGGWYLKLISTVSTHDRAAGRSWLVLTPDQDARAVEALRAGYLVQVERES